MDIPEELQKRWSEREQQVLPEIATIDLSVCDPRPPELDSLEESLDFPEDFYPVPHVPINTSPWIDPLKLHGARPVGMGSISIAGYAPQ